MSLRQQFADLLGAEPVPTVAAAAPLPVAPTVAPTVTEPPVSAIRNHRIKMALLVAIIAGAIAFYVWYTYFRAPPNSAAAEKVDFELPEEDNEWETVDVAGDVEAAVEVVEEKDDGEALAQRIDLSQHAKNVKA